MGWIKDEPLHTWHKGKHVEMSPFSQLRIDSFLYFHCRNKNPEGQNIAVTFKVKYWNTPTCPSNDSPSFSSLVPVYSIFKYSYMMGPWEHHTLSRLLPTFQFRENIHDWSWNVLSLTIRIGNNSESSVIFITNMIDDSEIWLSLLNVCVIQ